ncbi:hypothetical protein BSLG_007950 [Batrachochytrium salamandrivorans]|nr:hypothetical protein BASA83_001172 [Batrachochytrium salamandrivorans]KAJ1334795.1 hypothetical protein BSLG_007950 [Batrachochytrium salamandrivorans]
MYGRRRSIEEPLFPNGAGSEDGTSSIDRDSVSTHNHPTVDSSSGIPINMTMGSSSQTVRNIDRGSYDLVSNPSHYQQQQDYEHQQCHYDRPLVDSASSLPHRQCPGTLPLLRPNVAQFEDPTTASAAAFHADRELYNSTAHRSASIASALHRSMTAAAAVSAFSSVGACSQHGHHEGHAQTLSPLAHSSATLQHPRRNLYRRHPAGLVEGGEASTGTSSSTTMGTLDNLSDGSGTEFTPSRPTKHGGSYTSDMPILHSHHQPIHHPASFSHQTHRHSTSVPNLSIMDQQSVSPATSQDQQVLTSGDRLPYEAMADTNESLPECGLDYDLLASTFEKKPLYTSSKYAMSRFMFFSETTGVVRAPTFDEIDLKKFDRPVKDILEEGPFWLDVCQPTSAEMASISRAFGIHPLTSEDIQTPDTREKCEVFNKYYFIVIRSFEQDHASAKFMAPIPVYIVVFRECVISFHFRSNPHSNNVLNRIDHLHAYGLQVTTDWINYALIDDITDSFIPLIKFIELEVDNVDELVLILKESEQSDMLRRIGHARKQVTQLLRLLSTKADVVKTVINRCMERLASDSETRLYLEDIHDHVITMMQNLLHSEKTLARSHSNYLAQISIEITQASNRTSDVVMRMTALASILVPLNVVTGLWGMNVQVPGQEIDGVVDLRWFFAILTGMMILAAFIFYVIRKAKLV